MKPTQQMIDKAARRGALLQNVQVIMWEFVIKRDSNESVNWIEYANKIIDAVERKNKISTNLECDVCHKKSKDVSSRPDWYARDVGNCSNAFHIVCNKCHDQNSLDT